MKWNVLMLAVAAMLAGCVDFNYVGQEFAPIPAMERVLFFKSRAQLPVGKYQIIGRATVEAPDGTDIYDIEELLLQRGREYGADAVCVVNTKKVQIGAYEVENADFDGPNQPLDPSNLNWDGEAISVNTFGEQVGVGGEVRRRIEVVVTALFLKDRAVVRKLLAERGRELEELMQQPVVEPARPEVPSAASEKDAVKLPEGVDNDAPEAEEEVPGTPEKPVVPTAAQE